MKGSPPLFWQTSYPYLNRGGEDYAHQITSLPPLLPDFRPSHGPSRLAGRGALGRAHIISIFFDDHASGIGYLRFRQQKARLASFLNVPTANLGLIP